MLCYLPKSEQSLLVLQDYLSIMHKYPKAVFTSSVRYSKLADNNNEKSARSFCFTKKGSPIIYTSDAIECVSEPVRLGILLHELGHLWLNAFNGDESEVAVDEWCVAEFPEIGYHYTDHEYSVRGAKRIAKSVQSLKPAFVRLLQRGR